MTIPGLSEATLREQTEEGSFERGEYYFQNGAVQQVDPGPDELEAFVQGSQPSPYVVRVQYGDEGIQQVRCTCPFHEGSWCKHIVAALLAHLREHQGEHALQALVEDLDREELVALLGRLAERDPRVKTWVKEDREA